MCKFIGMEDLVANALIELIEKNDCNKVKFDQIIRYGNIVIRFLREENDEEAVLLISKYYTNQMIRNYSDFFEIEKDSSGEESIVLKLDKNVDDLRNHFRAYLSFELLFALTNENSLRELGIAV